MCGLYLHWCLLKQDLRPKSFVNKIVLSVFKSSVLLILLSMDNVAIPVNRCCDIVERRYDFMSFNLEKLLSAEATVTGAVKTILRTMHTLG
jgi:hypothetical protein